MIIPQINIWCVIDVIGALKNGTLGGNLHMMDNSRSPLSSGQGSEALSSAVKFTQVINWHVMAIDVQTDIFIRNIFFFTGKEDDPCAKLKKYGAPSGNYWAGIVNQKSVIEGGIYYYQMVFDMNGKTMFMDPFPSLYVSE
jgi:hypothetical protein